jgi:nitrogen-specific signal transduction histidine kinase
VAAAHDGRVEVTSVPGDTIFALVLPVAALRC